MPEKKKSKTAGETYDERARSLMKAIDVRRSERALDAPKVHMMQRVQDEYGRGPQIRDTAAAPFEFFPSKPSPGYEYEEQMPRSIEATRPYRTGEAPRSSWNGMLFDRGGYENEGISDMSGTPGELLPPYREKAARKLASDYEFDQRKYPQYADEWAKDTLQKGARNARKAEPPVTQEDIDAMREMFARPGETSNMRDYIEMLPRNAQADERVRRADAAWKRNNAPKKKGK
jgi:hypothetical protein